MRRLIVVIPIVALSLATLFRAFAANPQLTVNSPANGAVISGSSVTVSFTVTDLNVIPAPVPLSEAGRHPEVRVEGEGHVHITLDTLPLVLWPRTEPYTFTDVPAGDHQLTVELMTNDHTPHDPPVVRQIRFRTVALVPRSGAGLPAPAMLAAALLALIGLALAGGRLVARRRGA